MGDYKDKTGKTRVGAFLSTIGGVAPDLLKLAGNVTGVDALTNLGQAIDKHPNLTPEQKATAKELLQLDLENTKDARAMQVAALAQNDLFSKRFIYYLASFWSTVGGIFIFIVLFKPIPASNVRLIDTILGFLLGTIVATIINFFFGSSAGSKEKTKDLTNAIKK